jgi:hypothetical protein
MPPEKKVRRDLNTGAVERNLPSKPWWLRPNITAFLNQISLEAGRHLTEALVELGACRQEAKTFGKPTTRLWNPSSANTTLARNRFVGDYSRKVGQQVSLPSADRLLDAITSFETALTWPEAQQRIQNVLQRGLQGHLPAMRDIVCRSLPGPEISIGLAYPGLRPGLS